MPLLTKAQIESAFQWGKAEEKSTKRGPRIMRKAPHTPEAHAFYKANRNELAAAGIMYGEWPINSGKFSFTWFQEIPQEVIAERQANREASRAVDADVELIRPDGLEYMGFQKAGIKWMLNKSGVLLADEMGLGKTIQIIGVTNQKPETHKVLIVCPAFLTLNWLRELRKWIVNKDLSIGIVDGKVFPTTNIVIIGYSMLKKWRARLETVGWDIIACDEGHYLKNPQAERSKVILGYKPRKTEPVELAKAPLNAKLKIVATGTPICNRPLELWPLIHWVNPEIWNSWWNYATTYAGMSRGDYGMTGGGGAGTLEKLQDRLRETTMIRRKKADVLKDLPAKMRQVVTLECPAEVLANERNLTRQRESVEDAMVAVELAKAGEDPEAYLSAIAELSKGVKVDFTEVSLVRHQTALAKVPATLDYLEGELESGVEKMVVFAHHIDVIEELAKGLAKHGVLTMTGSDDVRVRQANVDRFQNDASVKVFILGLIPGGVGWTLTASSYVYFHELDWVPGNVWQAEDRCHRIGQRDSVTIKYLVFDGTIDCNIATTIVRKAELIERALDKEMTPEQRAEFKAQEREAQELAKVNPWLAAEREAPATVQKVEHISPRRDQLDRIAAQLNDNHVECIHAALRALREMCDGAAKIDGAGFNKLDARIGRQLADSMFLTKSQAALGFMIARKYHRQIGNIKELVTIQ